MVFDISAETQSKTANFDGKICLISKIRVKIDALKYIWNGYILQVLEESDKYKAH